MKQSYSYFGVLLSACLLATPLHAAIELDIHGSMAQGYIITEGNNAEGSSLNGSRDWYEVAINGRTSITPRLLVSGQLMARRSGMGDDGGLRVDYAQLDYQFWTGIGGDFGARVGKLKNPYGFYNDTRDVVFSRPGITMPSSVYFDAAGIRDVLFSSEGVQGYGSLQRGSNSTEWTLGWARDYDATDAFSRSTAENGLLGKVEIQNFVLGQVVQNFSSERYRAGLSYLSADVVFAPSDPTSFPAITLTADLWVVSLQMQGERFLLTSELRYSDVQFNAGVGLQSTKSDGVYVQYRRFFSPEFDWYLRYDVSFEDRNDRDGRERASRPASPFSPASSRESAFSREHVVGLSWRPSEHWGVFAEYHYIDGTSQVSALENSGRELDRYWQKTLLMLAYRF
ncbi:MAG: hypothetical protein ACSHXK_02075 [Oceanococcus sp.]